MEDILLQKVVECTYQVHKDRTKSIASARRALLLECFKCSLSFKNIDEKVDEILRRYRERGGTRLEESANEIIEVYEKHKPKFDAARKLFGFGS